MKEVILGYDGSENGRRALLEAADLAHQGAKLTVLYAVRVPAMVGYPGNKKYSEGHAHAPGVLKEAEQLLSELGVEAELVEAAGPPETALIDEARERAADVIVVGTRGLNAAKRLVLGSVSTKLVHEAPCSVFVVR
jgi:nucleotide-binding universal stress UspA family protein